jgi:hypothetical protein
MRACSPPEEATLVARHQPRPPGERGFAASGDADDREASARINVSNAHCESGLPVLPPIYAKQRTTRSRESEC